MNIKKTTRSGFSLAFLILLSLIVSGAFILTSCGAADAKAEKSKKKKSKKSDDEENETVKKDEEKSTEKPEEEKKVDKKDEKSTGETKKEKEISADEIWADLMRGNKSFVQGKYSAGNLLSERSVLAKGQNPKVVILGCADSRVPPELVFGKNTGDLFVVRDAGNIADEIVLGSIEYAVEHLKAKVIVVLGHESCGAVAATVSGEKMPTENLQAIVNKISPALKDSKECPIGGKMNTACVELNVNRSAKNILQKSSLLEEATSEGLVIIRAVYHMETGEVVRLD
ncbi:MAG: carbonic anhydrase [Pyrinomonadaceae bacterium]